jgi:hypothetical protein
MNPFLRFYNAGDNRCEFTAGCLSLRNQPCNGKPQNEPGKTGYNRRSGIADSQLFVQAGAADSPEKKAYGGQDVKDTLTLRD